MWIDILTAVAMAVMIAALGFLAGCDWARSLSEDEEFKEDGEDGEGYKRGK